MYVEEQDADGEGGAIMVRLLLRLLWPLRLLLTCPNPVAAAAAAAAAAAVVVAAAAPAAAAVLACCAWAQSPRCACWLGA